MPLSSSQSDRRTGSQSRGLPACDGPRSESSLQPSRVGKHRAAGQPLDTSPDRQKRVKLVGGRRGYFFSPRLILPTMPVPLWLRFDVDLMLLGMRSRSGEWEYCSWVVRRMWTSKYLVAGHRRGSCLAFGVSLLRVYPSPVELRILATRSRVGEGLQHGNDISIGLEGKKTELTGKRLTGAFCASRLSFSSLSSGVGTFSSITSPAARRAQRSCHA